MMARMARGLVAPPSLVLVDFFPDVPHGQIVCQVGKPWKFLAHQLQRHDHFIGEPVLYGVLVLNIMQRTRQVIGNNILESGLITNFQLKFLE